jgi:hypothetical protein
MKLNKHSRAYVQLALISLNKTIHRLERVVEEDGVREIVFEWRNHLTSEKRAAVRAGAATLRRAVEDFSKEFDFERSELDLLKEMESDLTQSWISLAECKSKSLKGYGAMPPEEQAPWDAKVEELRELVLGLDRLLRPGR